ncbi:hypothetical protein PENSUB_13120 [Penicillium subrubescens]|uniref:Uncharacterized protein n=1 Tax=Penicillium subrubescens TaxID=1316194 RepID=A0A1Q5ST00_9EURO|nr:hypothetical protein PENSUB_13120 [Penicillium subrubescens]
MLPLRRDARLDWSHETCCGDILSTVKVDLKPRSTHMDGVSNSITQSPSSSLSTLTTTRKSLSSQSDRQMCFVTCERT